MDTKQKIEMAEKRITELQTLINYWNCSETNTSRPYLNTIMYEMPDSCHYEAA